MIQSTLTYLALVCLISSNVFAANDETPDSKLKTKFREILVEAKPQLGEMDVWQKNIFDQEILVYPQRFLGDYRVQGATVHGNADIKGIKQVMGFHAQATALLGAQTKAILYVQSAAGCDVCSKSLLSLKKFAAQTIERHGFVADVVDRENTSVESLMAQKSAKAYFKLILSQKLPDDPDDPHADEKNYSISLNVLLKGNSEISKNWTSDFLENEKFESIAPKVWLDAWSYLGSSQAMVQLKGSGSQTEVLISASGIRDYKHSESLKKLINEVLKDYGKIIERNKVQTKVVYALKTDLAFEAIAKVLSNSETKWREIGVTLEAKEP